MIKKKQESTNPKTILETAQGLVYGDRNNAYGHPTGNFQDIADLQNAYLGIVARRPSVRMETMQTIDWDDSQLSPIDVAIMNILQKVARLSKNQTHMDSITDIAGYAACMERIVKNK